MSAPSALIPDALATARDMPTVTAIRVRKLMVPLDPPAETASMRIPVAPLVLVDVETSAGITGHAYVFTYTPLALAATASLTDEIGRTLIGRPLAPQAIAGELARRFRLLGAEGLVTIAVAAIDMALWDALARLAGLPLVRLLGGEPRPVPAYGSLRTMSVAALEREVAEHVPMGFRHYKIKIGRSAAEDIALIETVRRIAGDDVDVMVDYNQSLDPVTARTRMATLNGHRIGWVEEPLPARELAAQAELRRQASLPLQSGENWWGARGAADALAAGATDLMMPDVMKLGGIGAFLAVAALAQAHAMPCSSHLFPEVSAHLLAVTPTAHLLEYLDFAGAILAEPVRVAQGAVVLDDRPGSGIAWNEAAITRYLA